MDIRVANQPVPVVGARTSFTGSVFEVIFLIIVTIVAYFYLVAPKSSEYASLQDQLSGLKKKQETITSQKAAFDRLVQQLSAEPQGVASLEQTLPLDSKPSKLYVLLESIMQSSGLTTGSVTIDVDSQTVVAGKKTGENQGFAAEHKVQPVPITVSAVGTIDQLSGFLHTIETSTRLLEIYGLEITQGRDSQLSFKVSMKAYSYAEAAAPATASK